TICCRPARRSSVVRRELEDSPSRLIYPRGVSDPPPYVERNRTQLERLRALLTELSDGDLARPVNESWSVAAVLGHIAFWDGRALFLADKLLRGEPFTASDDEPEDVDWINDAARPLIHAIPPRRAAELALSVAEETDERT